MWTGHEASREWPREGATLEVAPPAPGEPSDEAAPADSLTVIDPSSLSLYSEIPYQKSHWTTVTS